MYEETITRPDADAHAVRVIMVRQSRDELVRVILNPVASESAGLARHTNQYPAERAVEGDER